MRPSPVRPSAGFTMIELIVVIVILGILAATALPRFVNLRDDAQLAALDRYAGHLGSAINLNYSSCQAANNVTTGGKCVQVSNCTDAASLVHGGVPSKLPGTVDADLAIVAQTIGSTNGTSVTCVLSLVMHDGSSSQTVTRDFVGIAAGL